MPKSPEQNLMPHNEAEEEASKVKGLVDTGRAENYDEAEKRIENDKRIQDYHKEMAEARKELEADRWMGVGTWKGKGYNFGEAFDDAIERLIKRKDKEGLYHLAEEALISKRFGANSAIELLGRGEYDEELGRIQDAILGDKNRTKSPSKIFELAMQNLDQSGLGWLETLERVSRILGRKDPNRLRKCADYFEQEIGDGLVEDEFENYRGTGKGVAEDYRKWADGVERQLKEDKSK